MIACEAHTLFLNPLKPTVSYFIHEFFRLLYHQRDIFVLENPNLQNHTHVVNRKCVKDYAEMLNGSKLMQINAIIYVMLCICMFFMFFICQKVN